MTRSQKLVLIGLGIAVMITAAVSVTLLVWPSSKEPTTAKPMATVPQNSRLLTRIPFCDNTVGTLLSDQGWSVSIRLAPQGDTLVIQMEPDPNLIVDELPADQIWAAFEATLAGRASNCTGFARLQVQVGDYQALVAFDDLEAWDRGEIKDGIFTDRVLLTR